MAKSRLIYGVMICVSLFSTSVSADQSLADRVAKDVVQVSEEIWGYKLDKKLSVRLRDPADEKADSRYPSSWNPRGENYQVSLLRDFDLSLTWWNMRPTDSVYFEKLKTASLAQKYTLVLSHEITHLFTFPSPWQPWFQEVIGMRIGELVALRLDPSLKQFFDSKPSHAVQFDQLKEIASYDRIRPPHVEKCREFQRESYWYSLGFPAEHFVDWGKKVRNASYIPWNDKREAKDITEALIKLRPPI